jgi:putative two-component system response regulator
MKFAKCETDTSNVSASYVLVVDDDSSTRDFLRHWLEMMGYAVKEAASADSALAMMLTDPAAIVLCDIDMPGHDGLWFAERALSQWPSTAIVFASGVDKMETIERARWLGAVDYVQKPFQWEMIAQAMRRAGRAAQDASR